MEAECSQSQVKIDQHDWQSIAMETARVLFNYGC